MVFLTTALCAVLLARFIGNLRIEMPTLTGPVQFFHQLIDNEDIYNRDTIAFVSDIVFLVLCTPDLYPALSLLLCVIWLVFS